MYLVYIPTKTSYPRKLTENELRCANIAWARTNRTIGIFKPFLVLYRAVGGAFAAVDDTPENRQILAEKNCKIFGRKER